MSGALFPRPPRGLCLFPSLLRAGGHCWRPRRGAAVGTLLRRPEVQPSARFLSSSYVDSLQEGFNILVT